MKKYLYILCAMAVSALTSCSKSDEMGAAPDVATILTLSLEGEAPTRAGGATTYFVEVYADAAYTEPANIFTDGTTNKTSSTDGTLSMILDRSKDYHFLFWAHATRTDSYTTDDLKAVTLVAGKTPAEAWSGTAKVEGKAETIAVMLKRAVAKISLMEVGAISANSALKLTFSEPTKFNVTTGKTSSEAADRADRTENITITNAINATPAAPVKLNGTDIFVLASAGDVADVTDISFEMSYATSTDAPFDVTNVPLKANRNTNIKGHYSSLTTNTFIVTASDIWDDPDNDVEFPEKLKIGNFYYQDGTWSSVYTADAANPCIGIVFYVEADGKHGKVVGLTDESNLQWSTNGRDKTGAISTTDGRANMATVAKYIADNSMSWDNYPVFKWVAEHNGKTDGGWETTDKWYLPATEEFSALYAAWNGSSSTTADNTARNDFNGKLTTAQGTVISEDYFYWSSTESADILLDNIAWLIYFSNGNVSQNTKDFPNRVRAVLAF